MKKIGDLIQLSSEEVNLLKQKWVDTMISNQTAIFNEIVSSIIIMPREVEENPDDIEGVPVVEENVSTSNELEFVS